MGNSVAKELAVKEAEELKDRVARKCNGFVVGVENTSVVVNVELTDLKEEISALVLPFQDRPFRSEVGMLEMAKLIEDIERYANCHKHAIWAMMQTLTDCQERFEELVSSRMNLNDMDNIISDTAISSELRLRIENVLVDYERDVRAAGCWDELVTLRLAELERMLFKLGDSIIIQTKENVVNEFKNSAFEQIDEILTSEMCDGTFSDPESARSLLQSFVTVYTLNRQALEELPFLQRVQIERAQDKISEYVEDLIRRIQMVYAYNFDESSMKMIMDLEESDDSSDESELDEEKLDEESEVSDDASTVEEAALVVRAKSTTKATNPKSKAMTPAKKEKTAAKKSLKKSPASASKGSNASPVTGKRKRRPSAKVAEVVGGTQSRSRASTTTTPVTTRKKSRK